MPVAQPVETDELQARMVRLGAAARAAAVVLAQAPTDAKNAALRAAADHLRTRKAALLEANTKDLTAARARPGAALTDAFIDRLTLDDKRIEGMAAGLED